MAKAGYLDNLDKNNVRKVLDEAYDIFKATHQDVLNNINKNKEISEESQNVLNSELKDFFENLNQ